MEFINALKHFLHTRFRIKNLNDLKFFLGIKVTRSKKGIYISQRKCALKIIKDISFLGVKFVDFPMEESKLSNKREPLKDPVVYQHLVGRFLYLIITGPDITYYVHIFSRFMHDSLQPYMAAALRVVKYPSESM